MRSHFGVSAYPANAWNKKTVANYFECFPKTLKRVCTATLWGTWGEPLSFIGQFIEWAGNRHQLVVIHCSNECARRTGRAGKQIAPDLGVAAYDKALRKGDAAVLKLVEKRFARVAAQVLPLVHINTKIVLSVGLEDNLSDEAAAVLMTHATFALPNSTWKIARSRMGGQHKVASEWTECHGRNYQPGCELWNFDGVHVGAHDEVEDIGFDNTVKAIQKADQEFKGVFLWDAKAQGWDGPGKPYEGRKFEIEVGQKLGFRRVLKQVAA